MPKNSCFVQFVGQRTTSEGATVVTGELQDDLLFFVLLDVPQQQQAKQQPYIVRRRSSSLPKELQLSGSMFPCIDWQSSLLLNLVLQMAEYNLTVVACPEADLPSVTSGASLPATAVHVTRQVHASPTVTVVNLDNSKHAAADPQPCYPNICFAVDDFESAFEEVVLTHPQHCYVVLLTARTVRATPAAPCSCDTGQSAAGQAASSQLSQQGCREEGGRADQTQHASSRSHNKGSSGSGEAATAGDGPAAMHMLFAGYVSCQQIAQLLKPKFSAAPLLDALFSPKSTARAERVVMKGPEGIGWAEVAVSLLPLPAASTSAAGL